MECVCVQHKPCWVCGVGNVQPKTGVIVLYQWQRRWLSVYFVIIILLIHSFIHSLHGTWTISIATDMSIRHHRHNRKMDSLVGCNISSGRLMSCKSAHARHVYFFLNWSIKKSIIQTPWQRPFLNNCDKWPKFDAHTIFYRCWIPAYPNNTDILFFFMVSESN